MTTLKLVKVKILLMILARLQHLNLSQNNDQGSNLPLKRYQVLLLAVTTFPYHIIFNSMIQVIVRILLINVKKNPFHVSHSKDDHINQILVTFHLTCSIIQIMLTAVILLKIISIITILVRHRKFCLLTYGCSSYN